MKRMLVTLLILSAAFVASAEITYDYLDQNGVIDGTNWFQTALNDAGIDIVMTIIGTGGDLNSNSGGMGIGDALIDSTTESVAISFDKAIDFISIDLGNVGGDISSGASLTIGSGTPIDLYTGVSGFNGSTDVYTPASAIRVDAGDSIVLTGTFVTSSFELERMTFAAVPEPATMAMLGIGGLVAFLIRRSALK